MLVSWYFNKVYHFESVTYFVEVTIQHFSFRIYICVFNIHWFWSPFEYNASLVRGTLCCFASIHVLLRPKDRATTRPWRSLRLDRRQLIVIHVSLIKKGPSNLALTFPMLEVRSLSCSLFRLGGDNRLNVVSSWWYLYSSIVIKCLGVGTCYWSIVSNCML